MAWNPSPKVADCREIARKWGKEQVMIIAIDGDGRLEMATFGQTKELCGCCKVLGDAAFEAIERKIEDAEQRIANNSPERTGVAGTLQGVVGTHRDKEDKQ